MIAEQKQIIEGSPLAYLARVVGIDGVLLQQAEVASIRAQVFNRTTAVETYDDDDVSVSGSVFDELQTDDPRWTADKIGYNFAVVIPGAAFPDGSSRYQIEFTITPAVGDPFYLLARVATVDRFAD